MKFLLMLLLLSMKGFTQEDILLGKGTVAMLHKAPHNEWFEKKYAAAKVDTSTVQDFPKPDDAGFKILIVMGTWCSDSREDVPHFLKILDTWTVKPQVDMLYVDREKNSRVQGYKEWKITYVPTFIVIGPNGKEVGRITETKVSLEKDLKKLLGKL